MKKSHANIVLMGQIVCGVAGLAGIGRTIMMLATAGSRVRSVLDRARYSMARLHISESA